MEHPVLYASILHTLNPFLLKLFFIHEDFGIRWYGMAYLTGFISGFLIVRFMALRGRSSVPVDRVGDLVTYIAVGCMVGGRLGYCLFYKPELFMTFRSSFPFWDVLAVHEGGMASHGGLAGMAIAAWVFGRRNRLDPLHMFDLCILGGTIGVFCGRVANFINGELVGREAPPGLPWAVKFPQDMYTWPVDYLDQMRPHLDKLQALTPAVSDVGVNSQEWSNWLEIYRYNNQALNSVHNTLRLLIEAIQNGNAHVAQVVEPLLVARHPSQLYEALMEGLLTFLVCFAVWYKPRRPGVIAGVFVVAYSIVRILGEQFRLPDADIGYQALGFTRGQWLSFGLLAFGVAILWWWGRRPVAAVGGWGPAPKVVPDKPRKS